MDNKEKEERTEVSLVLRIQIFLMLYIILHKEIQKEKDGEICDFVLSRKIFFERKEKLGKRVEMIGGLGEIQFNN